jgi:hypothetical protein
MYFMLDDFPERANESYGGLCPMKWESRRLPQGIDDKLETQILCERYKQGCRCDINAIIRHTPAKIFCVKCKLMR